MITGTTIMGTTTMIITPITTMAITTMGTTSLPGAMPAATIIIMITTITATTPHRPGVTPMPSGA